MTPPPFSRIHLNTGWVQQKVPFKCTLITLSQLASLALAKVSSSRMPALFTRMSARPKFLIASSKTEWAPALARAAAEIVDPHRRALASEQLCVGFIKPATRPGDQRHLAVEQSHRSLP